MDLKNINIFQKDIESSGKIVFFKKDITIFENSNEKAYIVLAGKIKISRINSLTGKELILKILRKGDIYDISYILNPKSEDKFNIAVTLEDTEVLELPINTIRKWIDINPDFKDFFYSYVSEYITSLESLTENISLENTYTRLLSLIANNFNPQSKQYKILDNLNHEEIAALIGTVRAVLNRDLQQMKKEGIIDIKRKKIEVLKKLE